MEDKYPSEIPPFLRDFRTMMKARGLLNLLGTDKDLEF